MGDFTETLLKLTEFPFSYSLIGLISVILGHGIDPQKLSFAQIRPLLILMGFVATTLSICDPVGAAQRRLLNSMYLRVHAKAKFFQFSKDISRSVVSFAMNESEKDREYRFGGFLELIRVQAIKTKWISTEVDKITALVYFIVVISVFIFAAIYYPPFLTKFSQVFGNVDLVRTIIFLFSIAALAGVFYALMTKIFGSDGLHSKSFTVYKYLGLREAVRRNKDKEKLSVDIEKIEEYLNDNHWSLAEFWVDGTLLQYDSP